MYLSKLSARNLQGADFDLDLTRANAVIGDNFKGKSRILNAARLLLVGYLPELGMKPGATFSLASGPFMEVWGELTDGTRTLPIRRRWALRGDSVTSTRDIPDELTQCATLTVMLNAEEYFGLSDRDRVAYVFKHVGVPGMDIAKIADRLRAGVVGYEPKWPQGKSDHPLTPQEFIEFNLATCTEEGKKSKDWAKRMEETVRGLTGLRAQDVPTGAPRSELLDERARVARALTELNEKKGLKIGAFAAQRTAAERRKQIEREIQHGQKDLLEVEPLRTKLALLQTELSGANGAPSYEYLQELQAKVNAIVLRKAAALQELGRAERDQRDLDEELHSLDGLTSCPFCGAGGESWKGTKAAELSTKHHEAGERVTAAKKSADEAAAAETEARATFTEQQADFQNVQKINAAIAQVRSNLATLEPRIARVEGLRESLAALPAIDEALAAEVEDLQMQINVKNQEATSLEQVMKEQDAREAELGRLAEAEGERDKAQADEARWKQATELLRTIQGELVEAAFGPLLRSANSYFPGVLRAPLAYHAGEVGMWAAGSWVSHATFSGTEKALTYAAIQAALAASSPVRVMLLDELGRLTRGNAERVAELVLHAVGEGRLDQFFGVDPEREDIYRKADPHGMGGHVFNVITVR